MKIFFFYQVKTIEQKNEKQYKLVRVRERETKKKKIDGERKTKSKLSLKTNLNKKKDIDLSFVAFFVKHMKESNQLLNIYSLLLENDTRRCIESAKR